MRQKYLWGIVITVVIMVVLNQLHKRSLNQSTVDMDPTTKPNSTESVSLNPQPSNLNNQGTDDDKLANLSESDPKDTETVQLAFANHLKLMGRCLNYDFKLPSDHIAPTVEQVHEVLRPLVGESVLQMEDWTQQDLRRSDGAIIRVRTEMDYEDEANPVKRVQLYLLNAEGLPLLQNLDPQQTTNPSDSYIESLKMGAVAVRQEAGKRNYYQDNEELVLVEQDGQLTSFSFSKGDKIFSCSQTNTAQSRCQCM